jgi:hypothetical protein
MTSLWFVVPAHGRVDLARICLRQLRRTCDLLTAEGVEATAVVIADDENLDTARDLGFAWVERDNRATSRRFNDGIQFALDPALNPRPADYVVPCGSDDWVDHRLFLDLPPSNMFYGFQRASFVREDGQEISVRNITAIGGVGIRIYPAALMRPLEYRPAAEDLRRGCDTSIRNNLQKEHGGRMTIQHLYLHDRQIVDWKSPDANLNPYDTLACFRGETTGSPFDEIAEYYPAEAIEEMQALYASRLVPA